MGKRIAASNSFDGDEVAVLEQMVSAALRGERLSAVIAKSAAFAGIARKAKSMRERIDAVRAGTATRPRSTTELHAGDTFGRWVVLDPARYYNYKAVHVMCRCACGTVRGVQVSGLLYGKSKSCGCLRDEMAAQHLRNYHKRWAAGDPRVRAPGPKRKAVAA